MRDVKPLSIGTCRRPITAAYKCRQGRARTIAAVTVSAYERFPVASALCPPRLRPAVAAIYRYAKTADDLADEGPRAPLERLTDLQAYRADLHAIYEERSPSPRWPQVFGPLAQACREFGLPQAPLDDLLSGFEQDVAKNRYVSQEELLEYCRRAANPVGRLLLQVYGIHDEQAQHESDAICTGLQLANFWRDLSVDTRRGRLYVPLDVCRRHRVPVASLIAQQETPATHALVRELVEWTRELLIQGLPLSARLPGRLGWELKLVVLGGLRILEKIARLDYATLHERPALRAWDGPLLLWRALRRRMPAPTNNTSPR
nr:squalene synthase HpnC [Caldimonas mangrovi]